MITPFLLVAVLIFQAAIGHVDGDAEIITVSRDWPFTRWHGDCRITQLVNFSTRPISAGSEARVH